MLSEKNSTNYLKYENRYLAGSFNNQGIIDKSMHIFVLIYNSGDIQNVEVALKIMCKKNICKIVIAQGGFQSILKLAPNLLVNKKIKATPMNYFKRKC